MITDRTGIEDNDIRLIDFLLDRLIRQTPLTDGCTKPKTHSGGCLSTVRNWPHSFDNHWFGSHTFVFSSSIFVVVLEYCLDHHHYHYQRHYQLFHLFDSSGVQSSVLWA